MKASEVVFVRRCPGLGSDDVAICKCVHKRIEYMALVFEGGPHGGLKDPRHLENTVHLHTRPALRDRITPKLMLELGDRRVHPTLTSFYPQL